MKARAMSSAPEVNAPAAGNELDQKKARAEDVVESKKSFSNKVRLHARSTNAQTEEPGCLRPTFEHELSQIMVDLKELSSNWRRLQATLKSTETSQPPEDGLKKKRKRPTETTTQRRPRKTPRMEQKEPSSDAARKFVHAPDKINSGISTTTEIGKYVAVDCEMVGVGPNPDKESALARVSVVNYNGDQIYDSYVRPKEQVTDWRTAVSGILPKHMVEARSLEEVQADITKILQDRILVGHAIRNDLDALLLSHPKRDIRDTARHAPYRKLAGGGSPRLKILASELLGLEIQTGEHSSVEDARACMILFRRDKDAFEREHAKKWPTQIPSQAESSSQPRKP
jgi:RNA exonuclease 4